MGFKRLIMHWKLHRFSWNVWLFVSRQPPTEGFLKFRRNLLLQVHWWTPNERLAEVIKKVLWVERKKGKWVNYLVYQLTPKQIGKMYYIYLALEKSCVLKIKLRKPLGNKKFFFVIYSQWNTRKFCNCPY